MLKLFFCLRYIRRKKIVLLSVAAVALSVALLIVVTSLFGGFIKALEKSVVENLGDLMISSPVKIEKYPQFEQELEKINGVEAVCARLKANGLIHLGKGIVKAVEIWGIEPQREAKVKNLKQSLLRQGKLTDEPSFEVDGQQDVLGGFVSIGVTQEPDEKTDKYDFAAAQKLIGQQVLVTSGSQSVKKIGTGGQQLSFERKPLQFTVADIVYSGIYDFDKKLVYVPIDKLTEKLYPNLAAPSADHLLIKIKPNADIELVKAQINGVWSEFASKELKWDEYLIRQVDIVTSKEMQKQYIAEIQKQLGVLLLVFGMVSLSIILLVFCIFYMIVETKRKDVSILRSCGASIMDIAMIFIGFGICVGIAGAALGIGFGFVITKNINIVEEWIRIIFGLKLWSSSVYLFSSIPNELNWPFVLPISIAAVIAAAIGALIPAISAVRAKPVEILRYE